MIQQSDSIAKLTAALVQVQATVEGATKGRTNPAFKSKYADLSSVWEACREQLVTNGLTVVQFPGEMVDNRMTMTTQLSHESGEWMRGTLSIPLSKVDAQGYGSAVTYARRYALAAVVGVCPEDDDGNAASQRPPQQQAAPRHDPPVPALITDDQRQQLMTLATAKGIDARTICEVGKIDAIAKMPANRFEQAKAWIAKQPAREAASAGGGQSDAQIYDEIPYA